MWPQQQRLPDCGWGHSLKFMWDWWLKIGLGIWTARSESVKLCYRHAECRDRLKGSFIVYESDVSHAMALTVSRCQGIWALMRKFGSTGWFIWMKVFIFNFLSFKCQNNCEKCSSQFSKTQSDFLKWFLLSNCLQPKDSKYLHLRNQNQQIFNIFAWKNDWND